MYRRKWASEAEELQQMSNNRWHLWKSSLTTGSSEVTKKEPRRSKENMEGIYLVFYSIYLFPSLDEERIFGLKEAWWITQHNPGPRPAPQSELSPKFKIYRQQCCNIRPSAGCKRCPCTSDKNKSHWNGSKQGGRGVGVFPVLVSWSSI